MEDNKPFIETGKYDTRKDLLIHYLKILNDQNRPISFSSLVFTSLPGGGLPEFESVMLELEIRKLIIKTEQEGEPILGLPFHRTVDRRYSISLDGVEYLASLGIIEDKYKNTNATIGHSINNYGNMVLGDNPNNVTLGLDFSTQLSNSSSMAVEPDNSNVQPFDTFTSNSKSSIWTKIYKWTDHKLISMIVFAILGFIISQLLSWLGLF